MSFFDGDCLVVAEVAQAHDGSLGTAHAYIDAIARAGAGAVKFQVHIAAAESSPAEEWRVKFSPQDETRFDYWKRMEFSEAQWAGLKQHAEDKGLLFLASPFSVEAVDLLERIGVKAYKVASGEVNNPLLLKAIARTGKPVILSTGMSDLEEIDTALMYMGDAAVLQCTSKYPVSPQSVGLNMLDIYRQRYQCPVGLSDHSGTIYASLAAVTLDAKVIEVHVVFSRDSFGPDVSASITVDELKQLVDGVKFIETAIKYPVNKPKMADSLMHERILFGKSIVAACDIPNGAVIEDYHLTTRKPGTGIPAADIYKVIGMQATRFIGKGEFIKEADLA